MYYKAGDFIKVRRDCLSHLMGSFDDPLYLVKMRKGYGVGIWSKDLQGHNRFHSLNDPMNHYIFELVPMWE